jgi:hypothetical protein
VRSDEIVSDVVISGHFPVSHGSGSVILWLQREIPGRCAQCSSHIILSSESSASICDRAVSVSPPAIAAYDIMR